MSKPEKASSLPPWGTYAPKGLAAYLIRICQMMPPNRTGRTLAGLLRRMILITDKGPLDLRFFECPVRFHPHDNLTEKRVAFMPQFFDPEERAALKSIIHPGFVFIDIGANAGFYSLFVAAIAGKDAPIIAVEPQPEMARRLQFNCVAGELDQIIHEGAALSDKQGKADINIVSENRGASGFDARGRTGQDIITVRTMTLLALMDKHNIHCADAIKIDIEGAEDQVLPVFFETCPQDRLPKMLIIERNDDWCVDCLALARDRNYVEISATGRRNAIMTLQL